MPLVTSLLVSTIVVATAYPATAQERVVRGRNLSYSFHVGSANPLQDLDSIADANIHFDIDFTYRLGDLTTGKQINLKLYLGLNQFTAETFAAIAHPRWINVSLNAQFVTAASATGLRGYVQGGPGIYKPKSGSTEAGVNLGLGLHVPIGSVTGPFALEFGLDLHQIQTKPATRFYTVQLGVLFR
jgi:hypothetical protein